MTYFKHILVVLLLSSCIGSGKEWLVINQVTYQDLPGWNNDDHFAALDAFKKSCQKFKRLPKNIEIEPYEIGGKASQWQSICANINNSQDAKGFFEQNFIPYATNNYSNANALFTGYFEIELAGSRVKHAPYIYPVYKKPPELKNNKPYYSRAEIDAGALNGRNLEIAWVSDPLRLFFLHVQGSGRITMDDGSVMHVGYAAKNNMKYVSIGKYLVSIGAMDKETASKNAIETWFQNNPGKLNEVLHKNPSYVFFREIGKDGPIGGQGVPLTPMRSLAVDKKLIPYGTPVWVSTTLNDTATAKNSEVLQALLIAQDTGSAIKGANRADIFFGYGDWAEKMAGYQNNHGRYFVLLPK